MTSVIAIAAAFDLACGGDAAPANSPTGSKEAATTGKPTRREVHHRDFIKACLASSADAKDYCECAWEQTSSALTDDEIDARGRTPEKVAEIRTSVTRHCGQRASESVVRENYVSACTADRVEMETYCECTWRAFRQHFSPQQLGDEAVVKSETFVGARPAVIKACGDKMPESVAFDGYLKTCAESSSQSHCECSWKQLRKLGSPGEIEMGLVDVEQARPKIEAACGKRGKPGAKAGSGATK